MHLGGLPAPLPHPVVVDRHPLLLLVCVDVLVRVAVPHEGAPAGFVPLRSSARLKRGQTAGRGLGSARWLSAASERLTWLVTPVKVVPERRRKLWGWALRIRP